MKGWSDAPAVFMLPTDQLASLPVAAFFLSRGRVIPADLEAKVLEAKQKVKTSVHLFRRNMTSDQRPSWPSLCFQGYVPMYVNATAGTTVYGAFDPINEIADICEKYNMWLHVDVRSSEEGLGRRPRGAAVEPAASLLCVCVVRAGCVGRRSAHVQETQAQAERSGEVKGSATRTRTAGLF